MSSKTLLMCLRLLPRRRICTEPPRSKVIDGSRLPSRVRTFILSCNSSSRPHPSNLLVNATDLADFARGVRQTRDSSVGGGGTAAVSPTTCRHARTNNKPEIMLARHEFYPTFTNSFNANLLPGDDHIDRRYRQLRCYVKFP
jgi:hypothetical protein